MSALTAAAMGRRFAETQMASTLHVFTVGNQVMDPSTGEAVSAQTDVWSGPCRIRPAGGGTVDVGGAELVTFDYLISIPFEVASVVERMRATVTSSPDLAVAGISVEVVKVERGDTITARRLYCRAVV